MQFLSKTRERVRLHSDSDLVMTLALALPVLFCFIIFQLVIIVQICLEAVLPGTQTIYQCLLTRFKRVVVSIDKTMKEVSARIVRFSQALLFLHYEPDRLLLRYHEITMITGDRPDGWEHQRLLDSATELLTIIQDVQERSPNELRLVYADSRISQALEMAVLCCLYRHTEAEWIEEQQLFRWACYLLSYRRAYLISIKPEWLLPEVLEITSNRGWAIALKSRIDRDRSATECLQTLIPAS